MHAERRPRPLLVSIRVNTISNCCSNDRSIPLICATKTVASDRYKVVPSRLKLYPVGITKATIFRGTPNSSSLSMATGNADSELVVANAMATGSEIALINLRTGIFRIKAIGSSTPTKNTVSETYKRSEQLKQVDKYLEPHVPDTVCNGGKHEQKVRNT